MIAGKQVVIDRKQKALEHQQREITAHLKTLCAKQTVIERLEEQLRLLKQRQFGKRSEKFPGQAELQFFNEAELLELEARLAEPDVETVQGPRAQPSTCYATRPARGATPHRGDPRSTRGGQALWLRPDPGTHR